MKYSGADWVERQGHTLSSIGRDVADLLGWLFQGIYHIEHVVRKVEWNKEQLITVKIGNEANLATYDFNRLTMLVLICHHMAIRCEICPCNPSLLTLKFSRRQRSDDGFTKHPTIEESIVWFMKNCDIPFKE